MIPPPSPEKNVFIETIEDPEELTPTNLERLQKKHAVERVVVRVQWHVDARPALSEHARVLDCLPGVYVR